MNEIIQSKLNILQIYIDAVKKENYEQTFLWTSDERVGSIAYNAIIDKLKENKIGYRFIHKGFVIFNEI